MVRLSPASRSVGARTRTRSPGSAGSVGSYCESGMTAPVGPIASIQMGGCSGQDPVESRERLADPEPRASQAELAERGLVDATAFFDNRDGASNFAVGLEV